MKYTVEIDSLEAFPAWSGGKQNLERVIEKGRIDELDEYANMLWSNEIPSETEVNDFLWFDLDEIDEFRNLWDDDDDDDDDDGDAEDESVQTEEVVLKDDEKAADDHDIRQWRVPNPLGIDTIFVGTKKAAEEYGKKYGFTPEEVQ